MRIKLSRHAFTRFWDLHAWAGVVAGLVLYVMFVTGALTLFHPQHELWEEPLAQRAAAPGGLGAALERGLAAHGKPLDDVWFFPAQDGHGEARISFLDGVWQTYWIDGDRLVLERERFAHFVYQLHFLWHEATGQWLYTCAGLLAVVLLLALVTGVLIHVKDLIRQFHQFRPDRSRRVLWSDMHKVLGVMGLPFQLLYAYTGAFIVLAPLLLNTFTGPVFDGSDQRAAAIAWGGPPVSDAPAGAAVAGRSLDELTARARELRPDLVPTYYHLVHHGRESGVVTVGGLDAGTPKARLEVHLQERDGAVIRDPNAPRVTDPRRPASGPEAEDASASARRWVNGLHYVHFGGLALRFVFLVLALAGAATILTGNLVWLARRRRTRGNEILARLTRGVGAGIWVAIAALALASRALPLDWAGRTTAEELIFLGALAGCLGWALIARNGWAVLWRQLALAACLLVPVPILAARISSAGLFGDGPRLAPVVGADVGFLALAAALGAMALVVRSAARRSGAATDDLDSDAALVAPGCHDA